MSKTIKTKVQSPFEDFKGMNRNTDLCVDVKTFLFHDRVAQLGKLYVVQAVRDEEDHYTLVELPKAVMARTLNLLGQNAEEGKMPMLQSFVADEMPKKVKRNRQPYTGKCLNVSLTDDGCLLPHFKRFDLNKVEDIDALVSDIANDIYMAYFSLVEEKPTCDE